jgi:cyclopropane fatty-acyl-phospholipid synthase-like methyltransferase
MTKPFAESCEQNQLPILYVLQEEFSEVETVFEIGSGTGQHAVFFSRHLPHLRWQTSDRSENLSGIRQWLEELDEDRRLQPIELDVNITSNWPENRYDAVFSANAVHIMSWESVVAMFASLGKILKPGARLVLYGPFNYGGEYTSESNARFDKWLKARDPMSGIRDFETLDELARQQDMVLHKDYAMPANNRILIWKTRE